MYSTNDLLLSLQKSLLGNVRTDLRAVLLENLEREINVTFVLDHSLSEEDKDFYSEALIDFFADFAINSSIKINELFIYSSLPYFELNVDKGVFAFLRYEE